MSAIPPPDERGVIFPRRLPTLTRHAPEPQCAHLVQWFWVPRWDLPTGQVHRQDLLPFPAANLTLEPSGITITGPSTTITHKNLQGRGWALGALLQPAGLAALGFTAGALLDAETAHTAPALLERVTQEMEAGRDEVALDSLARWLEGLPPPPARALEANRLLRTAAQGSEITSTRALAAAMHTTPRTLQRLAGDFLGLTPLEVIRRYRLQESARQLREGTSTVAQIAARLGYSDQAHLAHDFRRMIGSTPSEYRRSAR